MTPRRKRLFVVLAILGGVAAGLARYFGSHLSRLAVGFLSEKLVMG